MESSEAQVATTTTTTASSTPSNVTSNLADKSYEEVMRTIAETRQKCQDTLNSCNRSLVNLQSSMVSINQTKNNIDDFYEKFNTAMTGLVNGISGAMLGDKHAFKKGSHSSEFESSRVSTIEECVSILKSKKKIVILTGAGVSIASGISGFRGVGAADLFKKDGVTYANEEISTVRFMREKPDLFWERNLAFVGQMDGKKPNISHTKINELMESMYEGGAHFDRTLPRVILVTQNIDRLHRDAIKQPKLINDIFEIHGDFNTLRCDNSECEAFDKAFPRPQKCHTYHDLTCSQCKKQARPNVLYFDESYSEQHCRSDTLKSELTDMDALICIGTTLETGFAAKLVSDAVKQKALIIEISITPVIEVGALTLIGKAEDVTPKLCTSLITQMTGKANYQPLRQADASNFQKITAPFKNPTLAPAASTQQRNSIISTTSTSSSSIKKQPLPVKPTAVISSAKTLVNQPAVKAAVRPVVKAAVVKSGTVVKK